MILVVYNVLMQNVVFWPQMKLTHFVKINFEIYVYPMKYFNQNLFCDIMFHMFIQIKCFYMKISYELTHLKI